MFSGSYHSEDVQFLLKQVVVPDTPVQLKEALIQSGKRHYSELLTREELPSEDYVNLFQGAMQANGLRVAMDVARLAAAIVATRQRGIVLVSLARAGTPIGVLLKRVLWQCYQLDVPHYSVSILRDVGLDNNALRYVLQRHAPESLVFVDGWTGKGVIAQQLAASLQAFAASDGVVIPAELYVLADLSGSAAVAASYEDYLIPSCLLNATVSGLVSRTVYQPHLEGQGFHGCVYYSEYQEHDLSGYFVDTLCKMVDCRDSVKQYAYTSGQDKFAQQVIAKSFLQGMARCYGVGHDNYIKPGIGEATRVLLRRKARLLLLRQSDNEATRHLRWLAHNKAVPIIVRNDLPYQAAAIIQEVNL